MGELMNSTQAASATADAILDAQHGSPSNYRRRAVRAHCTGQEQRISELEGQVKNLTQEVLKLRRACEALLPMENFS